MSKISQTQTVLATVFMVSMLLGFVAVAYIDYEYQNNGDITLLWESDSSTEFSSYNHVNMESDWFDYSCNGQFVAFEPMPYSYCEYNRTAVYSGNNTWTYSCNETFGDYRNYNTWVISLPNLKSWIITDMNITVSTPGDSGLELDFSIIYPIANELDRDRTDRLTTRLYLDYSLTTDPTETYNYDVPLNKALEIFDSCNSNENIEPVLSLSTYDITPWGGISEYAYSISVEIYGEQVSGWSLSDSTFTALAGATCLNVVIVIYMTDEIDVGGYVKNIQKRRR